MHIVQRSATHYKYKFTPAYHAHRELPRYARIFTLGVLLFPWYRMPLQPQHQQHRPFYYKRKEHKCRQNDYRLKLITRLGRSSGILCAGILQHRAGNENQLLLRGKKAHLSSYLRHSGLVRRVNEFRCVVVDVRHSHDHRNRPLFIGGLYRTAQLKKWINIHIGE